MLPQPLIPEREHCPLCGKHDCKIDKTGHHFISGCSREVEGVNGAAMRAQRHANHDHLRQTLYLCCKHAMTYAQEEPAHLFPTADASLRPDLLVSFPIDLENKTFALDVTLVCPFTGAQKGQLALPLSDNQDAKLCDVHARNRAKLKRDKYGQVCKDRGIEFVPFVMYTTGKIHSDAKSFLKKLASHAAEQRKIPEGVLYRYYLKMLSVTLVQRIGYTIRTRAMACTTNNYRVRQFLRNGNERALKHGSTQVSAQSRRD